MKNTKLSIISSATRLITQIIEKSSRRICSTEIKPFEDLDLGIALITNVPKLSKKLEYAPYIKALTSIGISLTKACEICGVSYSYGAKLNRGKWNTLEQKKRKSPY